MTVPWRFVQKGILFHFLAEPSANRLLQSKKKRIAFLLSRFERKTGYSNINNSQLHTYRAQIIIAVEFFFRFLDYFDKIFIAMNI